MARYPIPAERVRAEETISRSRFITTIAASETPEQARQLVAEIRAEFPDANHNCYAFVAGPPGSTARVGMSDDGEPSGTAGRPMLAVLLGCGVGEITAVVTRYFGGVKLGTGGLVRAYGDGVRSALAGLPVRQKVPRLSVRVRSSYRWISAFDGLLPQYEAQVTDRRFDSEVTWDLTVPEELRDAFVDAIIETSRGEARICEPGPTSALDRI